MGVLMAQMEIVSPRVSDLALLQISFHQETAQSGVAQISRKKKNAAKSSYFLASALAHEMPGNLVPSTGRQGERSTLYRLPRSEGTKRRQATCEARSKNQSAAETVCWAEFSVGRNIFSAARPPVCSDSLVFHSKPREYDQLARDYSHNETCRQILQEHFRFLLLSCSFHGVCFLFFIPSSFFLFLKLYHLSMHPLFEACNYHRHTQKVNNSANGPPACVYYATGSSTISFATRHE